MFPLTNDTILVLHFGFVKYKEATAHVLSSLLTFPCHLNAKYSYTLNGMNGYLNIKPFFAYISISGVLKYILKAANYRISMVYVQSTHKMFVLLLGACLGKQNAHVLSAFESFVLLLRTVGALFISSAPESREYRISNVL